VLRGCDVLEDEDFFARLDETELAARDFFDGGRIVAKALRAIAKAAVLGALPRDLSGELVVFATGAEHRQQSAIADKTVDDDQDGNEQHDPSHNPAAAPGRAARFRRAAFRPGTNFVS
jgi:hypothetical protein